MNKELYLIIFDLEKMFDKTKKIFKNYSQRMFK